MPQVESMPAFQQERERITRAPHCQVLEPAEFCEILVSSRALVRHDHPAAMLRGVVDTARGLEFLVEEEKLHEFSVL